MMNTLVLNGFEVDLRLARLMRRSDWEACRGIKDLGTRPLHPNSEAWLEYFKSSETIGPYSKGIEGVDFLGMEAAIFENANIRSSNAAMLHGKKSDTPAPGNFDPNNGYLIGFTCEVDEGVFVDLRPTTGPKITYSNHCISSSHIATAFHSIDDFVAFYIEQHGLE